MLKEGQQLDDDHDVLNWLPFSQRFWIEVAQALFVLQYVPTIGFERWFLGIFCGSLLAGCAMVERNSEPPCLRSPGKSPVQVQDALPDAQMQRLLGWLIIFQIYEPSVCESCPHMSFS